eukprot:6491255-Amphidinium_carterae.1
MGNFPKLPKHDPRPNPRLRDIDGIQHIEDETPEVLHVAMLDALEGPKVARSSAISGVHAVRARQGSGQLAPSEGPVVWDLPPLSHVVRDGDEGARVLWKEILQGFEGNLQIVLAEPEARQVRQVSLSPGQLLPSMVAVGVAEVPLRRASGHLLKVPEPIGQDLSDLGRIFQGDASPVHDGPLNVRVEGPSRVCRQWNRLHSVRKVVELRLRPRIRLFGWLPGGPRHPGSGGNSGLLRFTGLVRPAESPARGAGSSA